MVAEIDDLIVGYSMRREIITHLYNREGEQESTNCKLHLRSWPDDILRIKEKGHEEALSKFLKQLKHFIASH